jgi:hypothetical protein
MFTEVTSALIHACEKDIFLKSNHLLQFRILPHFDLEKSGVKMFYCIIP